MKTLIVLILTIITASGCSVGMAMSGKEDPNLSLIRIGATRGEVQAAVGTPVETFSNEDKGRTDLYNYEVGNNPSVGRAWMHGVFDVLTIGLWEVVGVPIEAVQGDDHTVRVTYDSDDRVTDFKYIAPVEDPEVKAQREANPNNTFE